jgi:hypothetical protein
MPGTFTRALSSSSKAGPPLAARLPLARLTVSWASLRGSSMGSECTKARRLYLSYVTRKPGVEGRSSLSEGSRRMERRFSKVPGSTEWLKLRVATTFFRL